MNRILKPAHAIMAALLAVPALASGAGTVPTAMSDANIAEIVKRIYPSVVRVTAQNRTRRVATGVVIDKDGLVVTTALMSPRDEKITLTTSDGRTIEAEFLGFDTETQLALLKAKDKGLPALVQAKSADLAPGSWVCAVGIAPEGAPAVTQGIVSSVGEGRLRLNIWITPGSSGGPVVDENGQMVGLLRGIYTEERPVAFQFRDKQVTGSGYVVSRAEAPSSGMAMAVPVEVVRAVSAEIKEKGKVERGWLGVSAGLNEDGKVEIADVDPESPAGLAKLREGDIIVKLNDKDVARPDLLMADVRKMKPGTDIVLKIERDGKPVDVKIKLGEYSEDAARREMEERFPNIFPPGGPPGQVRPIPPAKPGARPFDWTFEHRKFIGVYCGELNPELAQHFGVKEGMALIVSKLTPGGPAEKAGLKVGDVIISVDGKRMESTDELVDLVQDRKKGDKVKVELLRDKKPLTLDIPVEEEEVRGGLGEDDFQNFLESWQGYTDAFRAELEKWQDVYGPEIKANMDKLQGEMARNGQKAAKDVKLAVKKGLRKI